MSNNEASNKFLENRSKRTKAKNGDGCWIKVKNGYKYKKQHGFKADGKPYEISYTIEKSVPSNAIFTDTTYSFADSYDASNNKGATVATVTNAINALDGNLNNTTPGAGKTLTAFS